MTLTTLYDAIRPCTAVACPVMDMGYNKKKTLPNSDRDAPGTALLMTKCVKLNKFGPFFCSILLTQDS